MASVSVSTLVIFITSLVIAVGVAGTLTTEVARLSDAIDDQGLHASQTVRTDIEIISDGGSPVYDSGTENVTLLVKNVGSRDLPAEADRIDVLIDGQYQSTVGVTVVDGSEWDTDDVVELEISTGGLATGDHRAKVIVSGDEEVFEFRV